MQGSQIGFGENEQIIKGSPAWRTRSGSGTSWRSATMWRGRASRFRIKETFGEISIGDDGRRRIVVVGVVEM